MSLYLLKKQWLFSFPLLLHLTSVSQVNNSFRVTMLRAVSVIKKFHEPSNPAEDVKHPLLYSISNQPIPYFYLCSSLSREFNPLFYQVGQLSIRK